MFVELAPTTTRATLSSDPIHLITQFYIPTDISRYEELKYVLAQNVSLDAIDKIILLNETLYTDAELGISSPKITQIVTGRRLRFSDAIGHSGFVVLANADMFFDASLINIRSTDIHCARKVMALLRYEHTCTRLDECPLFGPRPDSQDVWIWHDSQTFTEKERVALQFELGRPGCDNKVAYLFRVFGFGLYNDPNLVKSYHHHASSSRNYLSRIEPPYMIVVPVDVDCPVFGNPLEKIRPVLLPYAWDGNDRLADYITRKQPPFIIPRVAGIETHTAYVSTIPDILQHRMKLNAGIYLPTAESVSAYRYAYRSAFNACDMYASWEPWGLYAQHIDEVQRELQREFPKPQFAAYAFDIFHHLHRPWTHALRGKRLLIVSPFVDIMKTQPQAYSVDLFPECTFEWFKPPLTHGTESSRSWDLEFHDMCVSIDALTFDVALCSCGGYGNPLCSHIYATGKSAIYVGGVLQMYFGIYGKRWLKERKDILTAYLTPAWKRPTLKPTGHALIESGCYW